MTDETSTTHLLELAADITVAWLSNPRTTVPATDLPAVIGAVHAALAGLSAPADETPAPSEYTPAVTVRRSLASKDHIISLIDGKPYKTLRRHLATHGLTPEQYRERYNLKPDYPMVSETYAALRRDLAKKIGLGRKVEVKAAKPVAKSAPKKTASVAPAATPDAAPAKKPAAGRRKNAKATSLETAES